MAKKDFFWFSLVIFIVLTGCTPTKLLRNSVGPEYLTNQKNSTKYLKIHLKDGGLCILKNWAINGTQDTISGIGNLYNYKREPKYSRVQGTTKSLVGDHPIRLSKNEVTLIETNQLKGNGGNFAAITIAGVPLGLLSVYCIANPKACFGSCPTFYAQRDGKFILMAEGFSSSISPAFEKSDVDMLYQADDVSGMMSLKLTNEALETHVVRYVDLLAFASSAGEKVYASQSGKFYRTNDLIPPLSAVSEEGNCTKLVANLDGNERFSYADSKNLAKKEEILLEFNNDVQAALGLLIASRQSLLTTHLFYQVMAYTGNNYGHLVSEVENGNKQLKNRIRGLWDQLGGIEIFIENDHKKWEKIEEINEMGPIATDVHLVKLPSVHTEKIKMKLVLNKGLWRIDYLALAKILGEETPVRIKPDLVLREDTIDADACSKLKDRINPLVTMPGDRFELKYKMPYECAFQVFIETKGYYLEWMREEWLAEQNLKKAAFAFFLPKRFLRVSAPGYKKAEPEMEKIFWESRYVRH